MSKAIDVLEKHGLLHEIGISKQVAWNKAFAVHLPKQVCSLILNLVLFKESLNTVHWFNTLELYREIFSVLNIKENGKKGNFSWSSLFNAISLPVGEEENQKRTIQGINELYNIGIDSISEEDTLKIIMYMDVFCDCVLNEYHFKDYIYYCES